jgi:hypothetical protein
MIIDAHVHLTRPGYVRKKFLCGNARMAASLYNRVHKTRITPDEYIEKVKSRVDPTGEKLVAEMDDAGIDKSVIFGVDWAYGVTGEPRVVNREQNRYLAEYAKAYPGRFIPLAALDPRRPEPPTVCWGPREQHVSPKRSWRLDSGGSGTFVRTGRTSAWTRQDTREGCFPTGGGYPWMIGRPILG